MLCFFFFKQTTAYDVLRSLVGSGMCMRGGRGGRHKGYGVVGTRGTVW